jgi:hypothetical protein
MWIMGLEEEFLEALPVVAKTRFVLAKVSCHSANEVKAYPCKCKGHFAPFFETVIRYLGGLLSAFALSGEPILLSRADDLGRMLLPAFNTSSGIPMPSVNTQT